MKCLIMFSVDCIDLLIACVISGLLFTSKHCFVIDGLC